MSRPVPFGKYILLERISVGGMAEVFKGRTFGIEGFARYVAIKRILPHLAEDSRFVDMFIDEAKMAVQLSHANIVQVIELGREGDDHFIAMEYIPGKDLLAVYHHLRKTKLPLPAHLVAYVGLKVAEGLDYAHRKRGADGRPMGIVHRDVSPQNVLVSYDGAVKLIDFGIAKADRAGVEPTKAGVLKGKFGYMSPELIEARTVDARSDVFSLGTVLWEMAAGRRLFQGDNEFVTLELVRQAEVMPPSSVVPGLPAEFDRIILRALARDPEARYAAASELVDDFTRFLHTQGHSPTSKPMALWLREAFAADMANEREKSLVHARLTMGADGEVVEADEDEEEPTVLWQPDEEMAAEWARATARPTDEEEVPDPLAALAGFQQRPTEPRRVPPGELPLSQRPTSDEPMIRPADLSTVRLPPAARSGQLTLALAIIVGLAATAAVALWLLRAPKATAGLVLKVAPDDGLVVRLGDRALPGSSPIRVDGLAEGLYPLSVERKGYAPWEQQVKLTAGQTETIDVRLRPALGGDALLRFELLPKKATVVVGGAVLQGGEVRVAAGAPVAIEVRADAFKTQKRTITPKAGPQTLRFALNPTPGSIFVDSDPPGTVYVEGTRRGRTPVNIDGLDIGRAWALRVEAPGHQPFERTVRFGDRRFVSVDAKLEKR